jgi:diguanylate cyclase (GGDEF)-like protein
VAIAVREYLDEPNQTGWSGVPRGAESQPAVSSEATAAAAVVVRQLIEPGAMRVTAEPIWRLTDQAVLGYQLRWRLPRLDALPSPGDFWRAAAKADLLELLDDALLNAQFEAARLVRPSAVLINLVGYRRQRRGVAGLLARRARQADIPATRVIWQLNESEDVTEVVPTADLVFDLRLHGFKVAFLDIGESRTPIASIARVRPEILHLDASLVHGLAHGEAYAAAMRGLSQFAVTMGSRLVAGDISGEEELAALVELGIMYGSGPLLGRPVELQGPHSVEPVRPRLLLDVDSPELLGEPASSPKAPAAGRGEAGEGMVRRGTHLDVTEELGQAARSLQGEQQPDVILELAADHLARLVPYDGLAIYQADWDALRFRPLLARSGSEPSYVAGVLGHTFPIGTGITGWALDLGTPQLVNDADAHPAAGHLPGTAADDESMLLVPLVAGDRRLGILTLVRFRTGAFSSAELTTASLIGHMLAAAWHAAQLYLEQAENAITDSLTGLRNSRWLRDSGRRELALAEREQRPLALVMLDLDKFKLVNDSAGHGSGDSVLRAVGRAIQASIRADDVAVRYGGEEFVLLLHQAGLEGPRRVWRDLRRRLGRIALPDSCPLERITASAGLARYPDHGRSLPQLLSAADAAMYAMKRRGGNRLATARPGSFTPADPGS